MPCERGNAQQKHDIEPVLEIIAVNPLIGRGPGAANLFWTLFISQPIRIRTGTMDTSDCDTSTSFGGGVLVLYFWYPVVRLGLRTFGSDTAER